MRILRVTQKLYPETTGGGAYHAHALSRDQAAMGHDVTVLTVTGDGDRPRHEERDGYTVIRRSVTTELLGNDLSAGVARFLHGAADYDVIHAHSHLYFSTNLAALKRGFDATPLAITNHGLYSQSAPEWLFRWYLRTIGRGTFDSADVVFCYTAADGRRLRKFGVETDIAVVPNGIDTDRFRPDGPTNDLIETGDPTILFVGRLVGGKRPNDALAAIERVRDSHPDARLVFAGDGPLRTDLKRRAADSDLGSAVELLGAIPYEEMPKLYRAADLFVLPSRAEGLPRTVLEALSTGVPVVTSDLRQLRSIVEGVGHTVPVGDVAGFAAALNDLASAPEHRRKLGERGRELVTAEYDWSDTAARTTAQLERLHENADR
jgi:glycosyltransferase involved in cell wall biosynthesis